jgi:hypothetical protein
MSETRAALAALGNDLKSQEISFWIPVPGLAHRGVKPSRKIITVHVVRRHGSEEWLGVFVESPHGSVGELHANR